MALLNIDKKKLSILFTHIGLLTSLVGGEFVWGADSQNETEILRQYQDVQQILDRRCTVCHSCTESPCQLNLTSADYIRRGISKGLAIETRLLRTKKKWPDTRSSFNPILPNQESEDSLMLQALVAGNVVPSSATLHTARSLIKNETLVCPQNPQEYHSFLNKIGPVGMPLGLPSLPQNEFQILTDWLDKGAPLPSPYTMSLFKQSVSQKQEVQEWEDFFNEEDPADQARHDLVARYIFEHMSLSHLVLSGHPAESFELVRAENRYGFPIQILRLNRVNSQPRQKKFYYRLSRVTSALLRKTHLVWNLDSSSRKRFQQIFFSKAWALPEKYVMTYSGNPFGDFAAIPAEARSQFMLENSREIIDQMVRGPVCVGPAATYAIRDHFWVMFLNPQNDPSVLSPDLQKNQWGLPTRIETSLDKIADYQDEWMNTQKRLFPEGLELDQIWRGHANSQLTVFRHRENSSVHRGFIGAGAPTLWILSYSNFERLYYNLVVNFEARSSSLSMLETWNTMREIRQEGEELFLLLLPEPLRDQVRKNWNSEAKAYDALRFHKQRALTYPSSLKIRNLQEPVKDVLTQLSEKVFHDSSYQLFEEQSPQMKRIEMVSWLPELSYVVVTENGQVKKVNSLLRHRWFTNLLSPLQNEEDFHVKDRDRASWMSGVYGSHPSMIFFVESRDISLFLKDLQGLNSAKQLQMFLNRWGLRRDRQDFWIQLDKLIAWMKKNLGQDGGLVDLGQYDLEE